MSTQFTASWAVCHSAGRCLGTVDVSTERLRSADFLDDAPQHLRRDVESIETVVAIVDESAQMF